METDVIQACTALQPFASRHSFYVAMQQSCALHSMRVTKA
jgi:hypothetical protein